MLNWGHAYSFRGLIHYNNPCGEHGNMQGGLGQYLTTPWSIGGEQVTGMDFWNLSSTPIAHFLQQTHTS